MAFSKVCELVKLAMVFVPFACAGDALYAEFQQLSVISFPLFMGKLFTAIRALWQQLPSLFRMEFFSFLTDWFKRFK